MRPKESKRALPFQGQAIKFGEACLIVEEPSYTFILNENHWFTQMESEMLPVGTIIVPVQCMRDSWREVTKCLAGGLGLVFIDIKAKVERL